MLDDREMECGGVGDRLDVARRREVMVRSRNSRKLALEQTGNGRRKGIAEIGILPAAAVTRPPGGVDGKLHEIGEPGFSAGPGSLATGQRSKLVEIGRSRAHGHQICVQESKVSDLVIGIVVNVLREIRVENLQLRGVGSIPSPAWHFSVLHSAQFVVLHPKIGLQDLGGRGKAEQSRIPPGEVPAGSCQEAAPSRCCSHGC